MHYSDHLQRKLCGVAFALLLACSLTAVVPTRSYADETPQDNELYALDADAPVVEVGASADEGPLSSDFDSGAGVSDAVESENHALQADETGGVSLDTTDAEQPQMWDELDQPDDTSDATLPADDAQQNEVLEDELSGDDTQDTQAGAADPLQQAASDEAEVQAEDATQQEDEGPKLPKGAATIQEGTYYLETGLADDQVLGVNKREDKAAVCSQTYAASSAATQTWYVVQDEETGWYRIYLQSADSGYVLGKHQSSNKAVLLKVSETDDGGNRALWAFVPNGSWYNLVNRSATTYVLRFADDSSKSGSAASLGESSSQKKVCRYYLLEIKPDVRAESGLAAGAYSVAPTTNEKLSVEVRGASSSSDANVWLYTSNGKNHQKLYLEAGGDGYYTVWVVGTGKVLAQASASVIPGNNVIQKGYDSSADTQKWVLRSFSDGTYALVNKATGLALGATGSSSGSNLVGTRNDGYKTTRFTFTRKALLSAGIVEIHPRTSSSVSLDVRGASTGTAGLLLWTNKDALNQRFELVSAGKTDCWRIRTASSGGWITYTGAESAAVQQTGKGSDAKTDAATWQVVYRGGWYSLINVASGKALDMRKGSTDKGTQIIAYTPNGKDSQHFTIVQSTLIAPGYYSLQNGGERYLSVKGSSRKDGANVQVNDKTDHIEQLFQFEQSGSSWSIQNALSELYLTVIQVSKGSSVKQKEWTGVKTQLWKLVILDGGSIGIRSTADSSLGLVAYKAGAKDGADVYVTTAAQNAAQSWKPAALCDGTLTQKQEKVLVAALKTPSPGAGYCAGWVTNVFKNAGIGYWEGDACDQYRWFCKSNSLSYMKPGMIVAVSTHGHTSAGSIYGHVGIYVGNGKIMDNVGSIRTMSVYRWISYYCDRVTAKWGWFGKALA